LKSYFATILALCLGWACTASENETNANRICEPQETRACNCDDTEQGTQVCRDDDQSWSSCRCTIDAGQAVADAGETGAIADAGSQTSTIAARPRNILLIISDDLGVDASMCYGKDNEVANTPNLKALCDRGVVFNNAWSNPICSPTRATMLTGRYSFRTGVGAQVVDTQPGIQLTEMTIPKILKQAGTSYRSANIGKWHLSDRNNGNQDNPQMMGYDHFSGLIIGAVQDYNRWDKTINGVTSISENYITSENIDDAIAWANQGDSPWFMWLAFVAPHTPFHLPPANLHSQTGLSGDQNDIDANPLPYFHAMIQSMDTELGRLFSELGAETLANTEIIYIGDNGTPSIINQTSNRPRRGKGSLYQGGIHVPLIIAGPSVVDGGRTVDALVNGVDIFNTILEFAGVDLEKELPSDREIDSKSLLPYLQDAQATPLREWIYSDFFGPPVPASQAGYTIRNDKYKFIHLDQNGERLYRIDTDPSESTNLLNRTLSTEDQENLNQLRATAEALRASEP